MKKAKSSSERRDDDQLAEQSSAVENFLDPRWTEQTPDVSFQLEFERYHRYLLARQLCRGKDVLDVASDEGYGSALLAQVARSVAGVDSKGVAVSNAIATYSNVAGLS